MPTLEAVNMMRVANGQPPLDKLPEELAGTGGKEGDKDGASGAAGSSNDKPTDQKNDTPPASGQPAAGDPPPPPPQVTDEAILAMLKERGIHVDSIDALKPKDTPVDPAVAAAKREADELAFGLGKGLFNKAEYDQFVFDSKDPIDVVMADYMADAKAEDPELSDQDIIDEFNAKYGLNTDPSTRQHKRGLKEIQATYSVIMKNKHKKIFSAKDAFTGHETSTKADADKAQKVTAGLPAYQAMVDEIFEGFKELPFNFSENEAYKVSGLDAQLTAMKNVVLSQPIYTAKILQGYDKEKLKNEIYAGLVVENVVPIAQQIAKQYMERHAAGSHGVPLGAGKKDETQTDPLAGLTEAQKLMVQMNKEAKEKADKEKQKTAA